jgi:sulfonate transport system substrate-binding protein
MSICEKGRIMRTHKIVRLNTVGWSIGFFVAVIGAASGASADEGVTKGTAVPPSIPSKTRVVHIALTDVTSVAAKKGWFAEEFAKYNAKPDMVLVSAYGGTGIEAALLDRGDLHITQRMAYPALQHRVNGLDAVIIWQGVNPHPRRATTIVLADSNINSIADLKGKSFGSSLVGCPYYASLEALRNQGVTVDTDFQKGDARFINITGAAATSAFLAGRFDASGIHPATSTTASLYIQKQVKELATAVPDGIYVTAGGRAQYFAMRKWAIENPDLVKAFLVVWDRTVRWLDSENGAHLSEAATIASRELRISKALALYGLKDESTISYSYGVTNYREAVDSIKKFQDYQISVKDPFYTKHHLTDKEIEAFVDRRFFAGGEYFVDSGKNGKGTAEIVPDGKTKAERQVTVGLR